MIEIFILLITFQIKHFLADYPLQFPYMYENKGKPTRWAEPLARHAWTHALLTMLIVSIYMLVHDRTGIEVTLIAFGLVLFDFVTHFVIDRWKATRKGGPDTSGFWINLGLDQMFHHLVGIAIVYILIQA